MTLPLTYPIVSDGPLSSPASGRGRSLASSPVQREKRGPIAKQWVDEGSCPKSRFQIGNVK